MKKILTISGALLCTFFAIGQQVSGKPVFQLGQQLDIQVQMKTTIAQQAGGQAIDFNVEATGNHAYKVTNATEDNTTLHHDVQRITFSFDGMGQKRSFDSNVEKDMNSPFGKPVKELLSKSYDVVIDPGGKVLMAIPEKIKLGESDSRMAIITGMMKDVLDIVQPPQKGKNSFFSVLPATETGKGQPWTESYTTENGTVNAAYVIADINDSTIVVDVVASSVTVTRAEMMGTETTTTMNNKSTGKVILDRITGIVREKTISTESHGNTESPFGTLPVTSKTTVTIVVTPKK